MAQSVDHLTLNFGSGHDLTGLEMDPELGSELTGWSLLGILSLPLPHSHTLSQNKETLKNSL